MSPEKTTHFFEKKRKKMHFFAAGGPSYECLAKNGIFFTFSLMGHSMQTQPEMEVIISEFYENFWEGRKYENLSWTCFCLFLTFGLWDIGLVGMEWP